MKTTYVLILSLIISFNTFGQFSIADRARKAYDNMFYAEAAELYQELVDRTGGTEQQLINLADSYLKLNEHIDAELTLEKLFKQKPKQSQEVILQYAQVLAQNERYDESRKYYEMYTKDDRGKEFSEAYKSLNKFYRDSSEVSVRFLPVNTLQGDFSPALYEDGLVFSSNRTYKTGIKNVFGWNQTPYTDLYYLRNRDLLNNRKYLDSALSVHRNKMAGWRFNHDYTASTSNDSRTIGHLDPYYLISDAGSDGELIPVEPFDKNINTKYHEGPVSFSANYDTVFFTRNSYYEGKTSKGKDKVTRLQIFYAIRTPEGKFENVKKFPYNNPNYSVGHPALSPDGKRLYFVSDQGGGYGETDIYYCTIREHRFTEPVNAGPVVNTPGSEMFPYFNRNGSMFFSSDGHAGLGGLDIFSTENPNNEFQSPRNMGYPINSAKDDFGICSSDRHGSKGYFSSNRLRGRADDNIYSYTDRRPHNILVKGIIKSKNFDEDGKVYIEPLNNAVVSLEPYGDEVVTDRTGYFEFFADRGKIYTLTGEKEEIGKQSKEINLVKASEDRYVYEVELLLDKPLPAVTYTAKVLEAGSQEPISDAPVYIYDTEGEKAFKAVTGTDGSFSARLHPNRTYILKSSAEGSVPDCYKLQLLSDFSADTKTHDLHLETIDINTTFEVKNLLYDYNESDIRADAAGVLDNVVRFLKENPQVAVEIGSHTDSRGDDEYNQQLSAERAESAANYIIGQGIDSSRITAKGYGETQLLNKCKNNVDCSEEEHQQNRRTEVKVTDIKSTIPENYQVLDTDPEEVFRYMSDFSDCEVISIGK